MRGTGIGGRKRGYESTIGGRRSRIGSNGRESQRRRRRTRHYNRNEAKCEVTHHKLRVLELDQGNVATNNN